MVYRLTICLVDLTLKTANEDIQVACKTTGLSSDAIESLRFDHSQSKRRDIFAFEDFLIKESYVTFWAVQMRNSVKNIIQVNSLQSKLGSDIVTDETNFHRWLAMSSFEKSFNKAVEEFANLYSDDLKLQTQMLISLHEKTSMKSI